MTGVLMALVFVLVSGVLLFGQRFYVSQRDLVGAQVEEELAAIAALKTEQVTRWRSERLADVSLLGGSQPFYESVRQWLDDPTPENEEFVTGRLTAFAERPDYVAAMVVDLDGRVLLGVGTDLTRLHDHALEALDAVGQARAPALTELQRLEGGGDPHLDVVGLLLPHSAVEQEPQWAVVLQCDVTESLYPMIRSWPMPSRTGESLVVIRDGDDALYLNTLRHSDDAALTLRIPLTQAEVPAVRAILGERGVVRGPDYRDEPVIAALTEIPDSEWRFVVKVDEAEAFAAWRTERFLIFALALALAAAAAGIVLLVWNRDHASKLVQIIEVERAFQQSESRYGATLMSIGDAVIATDDRCEVALLNPVAEELTGWSQAEAKGRPLEEVFRIVDERTGEPLESSACQVIRTGTTVDLANHVLLVSRDGTGRPIADIGAPVVDSDGVLAGVVLVFRDQTEERASRHALQLHKDRLEEAERHAGLASWGYDVRTGARWWSAQMFRMFGRDPAEGVPSFAEYLDYAHPDDREMLGRAIDGLSRGEVPVVPEHRTDPARGPERILSNTVHGEMDAEGRPAGFSGTVLDVTGIRSAQRELEQLNRSLEHAVEERTGQLQVANSSLQRLADELTRTNMQLADASAAKSRFLRAMSHELRTPLNSIIGFAGVMLQGLAGEITSEQERQLQMIANSGAHLLDLINDMLDLSRIEAGRIDLRAEEIDPASIVRQVAGGAGAIARMKGLDLVVDLPDEQLSLISDERGVRQILINLLGNAVKFTEVGRVRVSVRGRAGGTVEFCVSDTGPGVPEEDQERIFGEFVQAGNVPEAEREGTGLGLAISRGIAEALGGALTLESPAGEGATFTLSLPEKPPTEE